MASEKEALEGLRLARESLLLSCEECTGSEYFAEELWAAYACVKELIAKIEGAQALVRDREGLLAHLEGGGDG